jgi:hypothetical protein
MGREFMGGKAELTFFWWFRSFGLGFLGLWGHIEVVRVCEKALFVESFAVSLA